MAGRILTGSNQQPCWHTHSRRAGFIIDLDPQVFSSRLPWHPQAQQLRQLQKPPHPVRLQRPLPSSKTKITSRETGFIHTFRWMMVRSLRVLTTAEERRAVKTKPREVQGLPRPSSCAHLLVWRMILVETQARTSSPSYHKTLRIELSERLSWRARSSARFSSG
jgi:hypothetical protein